ncbi:MAG TPA: hypothetical protein VNE62_11245 [Actinomycetota bacterium]|nr:hypothetical protein [Actinomycetota bacterium]
MLIRGAIAVLATLVAVAAAPALGANPAAPPDVSGPASAAPPDAAGPYEVRTAEYDAGVAVVGAPTNPTPTRMYGVIHAPVGAVRSPVVLFMHGAHHPCRVAGRDVTVGGVLFPGPCPTAGPVEDLPSWRGYDYAGRVLASHGYTVVSPSVNWVLSMRPPPMDDLSLRADLARATLDLMESWSDGGGPSSALDLRGSLDVDRVVLVGHSRSADALAGLVRREQADVSKPSPYRALIEIGAVDFDFDRRVHAPTGLHFAAITGSCDFETGTQGARVWDRSRFDLNSDAYARAQFTLVGANHGFFNSEWPDEWQRDPTQVLPLNPYEHAICMPDSPRSNRLPRATQESITAKIVAAFIRTHVGAERDLEWLLTARGAPALSGCVTSCTPAVLPSYLPPAGERTFVTTWMSGANAAGGAITTSGGDLAVCDSARDQCPQWWINSASSQATINWNSKATVQMPFPDLVANRCEIVIRGAMNDASPSNDGAASVPWAVELVNSDDERATVSGEGFGWSFIRPPPSDGNQFGRNDELRRGWWSLSETRIPLAAFRGVHLISLKSVVIHFGDGSRPGNVQLGEVMFQGAC